MPAVGRHTLKSAQMQPFPSPFVAQHLRNAVAVNTTGLSLDESRLEHLRIALNAVPEHLLGWSELCDQPGHAAARCDAMRTSGGEALLLRKPAVRSVAAAELLRSWVSARRGAIKQTAREAGPAWWD